MSQGNEKTGNVMDSLYHKQRNNLPNFTKLLEVVLKKTYVTQKKTGQRSLPDDSQI